MRASAGLLALSLAATPAAGATLASHDAIPWPQRAFDAPTIAVGDFDGDGRFELVAHNDDQRVYVVSSDGERILAALEPDYPRPWSVRPINSPAVADVDGDGTPEIVVTTSAAVTCVFGFAPSASTRAKFAFEKRWCVRADEFDGYASAADAGPVVADATGDGRAEIFVQTERRGYFAYDADGRKLWSANKTGGNADALVTDLDADGTLEVVFFGDGGEVRALEAATGTPLWTFRANGKDGVEPGSIPIGGSAADLDGDGKQEVVLVARSAEDSSNFSANHFGLFVLSHKGTLRWMRQPEWGHPMSYTHPILEDVDGDGRRDILLMDWNTIGHKPGDWEPLGPANVFAYDADGDLIWRAKVSNTWSNDDLGLADFDGDGDLEVVAVAWGPSADGFWLLDAATGARERHVDVVGWTVLRGPTLGDFDADGNLDWAVSVHSTERGGRIVVGDAGPGCDVVWGGRDVPDTCDHEAAVRLGDEARREASERIADLTLGAGDRRGALWRLFLR